MEKEEMTSCVRLAKKGDTHAFARLYETIYRDLYKTAFFTLGNEADAENAVSDTVMDAYREIGRLRDALAFRAWIFRILSNKCSRQIKEYVRDRGNLATESYEEYAETEGGTDIEIDRVLDGEMVRRAFAVLSGEEKRIVTMTIYGELDSAEIAEILNINRNTVRSKYSRALRKMKKELVK